MKKKARPNTKPKEEVSEWSWERMWIRLILYPFCLGLIALGIYGIAYPKGRSVYAGISAICICAYYFYWDWRVLFDKEE